MKLLLIGALLIIARSSPAQSMLDQDPKERELSESLFNHAPASSIDATPSPILRPVASPTPIPAPTPIPGLPIGKESARMDIEKTAEPGSGRHRHSDDNWYTFGVKFWTVENIKRMDVTIKVILLDDRGGVNAGQSKDVILNPTPNYGYCEISMRWKGMGLAHGWAAKMTAKDGRILAVQASDAGLEEKIADPTWWRD